MCSIGGCISSDLQPICYINKLYITSLVISKYRWSESRYLVGYREEKNMDRVKRMNPMGTYKRGVRDRK